MTVIDVRGLRKTYRSLKGRSSVALDGMDLLVDPADGAVHGFLGPNGSGKTTTLRVLLGLVRADSGEVRLLGHRVPDELPLAMPAVGSLVEEPEFFRPLPRPGHPQLLAQGGHLPPSPGAEG